MRNISELKKRKLLFLTGTRADFGKLKPLIQRAHLNPNLDVSVFVTGMHMLAKYGHTHMEVAEAGVGQVFQFINQNSSDNMDHVLAKTIVGLSDYVKEVEPDMLLIHGDRVETLAGASVGALNNILVGHIEGGEVSGTVDELIRHAVTKLSHIHFVCNEQAKIRLIQMGEPEETIHIVGSPDIDVMNSKDLPELSVVQERYEFEFDDYGLLIFHPVTTELQYLESQVSALVEAVLATELNFIVIYPNNDPGTDVILKAYKKFEGLDRVRLYPSMRFEYFLTLLKNAKFMLGNSSAGIREAPHFGTPAVNVGSRQNNRVSSDMILNVRPVATEIVKAISIVRQMERKKVCNFGVGESAERFCSIISENKFWNTSIQKCFVDRSL